MSKRAMKGGAMLAPLPPALVSCGSLEKPNIITVGWTGMIATKPPTTYISVRPERYSHGIISKTGEFVINLCTEKTVRAADICGVKSGRDTDKFSLCSLTAEKAPMLSDCPMIAQCPVSIECKVREVLPMGSHHMFIADIVSVNIDEELWDANGKVHIEKSGLVAYAHGEYFALGRKLGSFGYSVKKKKR